MHHAFLGAAVLGLIAFAFGERAARAAAIIVCATLAGGALFFAYVLYCAVRVL